MSRCSTDKVQHRVSCDKIDVNLIADNTFCKSTEILIDSLHYIRRRRRMTFVAFYVNFCLFACTNEIKNVSICLMTKWSVWFSRPLLRKFDSRSPVSVCSTDCFNKIEVFLCCGVKCRLKAIIGKEILRLQAAAWPGEGW